MSPTHQSVAPGGDAEGEGLRSRKKRRTWLAIHDAALELVDTQGYEATTVEQIAARAEVSVTTFFRYFTAKDEAIFPGRHDRLPVLRRVLLDRPASEGDLEALRHALQEALRVEDEPARFARQMRVITTSSVLRGRAMEADHEWLTAISQGLAERRGLAAPDLSCHLTAAVGIAALGRAITFWAAEGGEHDLRPRIDEMFQLLTVLAAGWAESG